jgi:hypothetical protein
MAEVVLRHDDDVMEFSSIESMSDDDGIEIKSKGKRPVAKKINKTTFKQYQKPKPQQSQYQPPSRPQPIYRPPPPDIEDNTFESFSNPQKAFATSNINTTVDNDDDVSIMSSLPEDDHQEPYEEEVQLPSPGFSSIEEEKQDMVYKFHRLESKGCKLSKKYNMHSDINEMRGEYNRIKRDSELNSSLKFSRRMLMACVSGMEFINKTYDPFQVELNGWSENVMENLNDGDFDNVFERLHDKYSGKVNTPPEMELMLSLTGSALMFHITSSMFKNIPAMGDPAMMRNMVKNMTKQQQDEGNQGSGAPTGGKGFDFSNLSSMFSAFQPPQQPQSSRTNVSRQPPRDSPQQSIVSDDSDNFSQSSNESGYVRNVALSEGTALNKRGRKSKITMSKANTINI